MAATVKVVSLLGQSLLRNYGDKFTEDEAIELAEQITVAANEAVIMIAEDSTRTVLKA